MAIGIGVSKLGIGVGSLRKGWTAQYKALYDDMATKPTSAIAKSQNLLIKTLVDSGIYAKGIIFYLFAQQTGGSLLRNIIALGTRDAILANVAGSNPTFSALSGYMGSSVNKSYIRTQWTPSVDGVATVDNLSALVFHDNISGTNSFALGTQKDVTGETLYMGINFGSKFYSAVNNATAAPNFNDTETRGFFGMCRLVGDSIEAYINQKKFISAQIRTGLSDNELILMAANLAGSPSYYSTNTLSFFFLGTKLTTAEIKITRQAIGFYMRQVGRGWFHYVCDGDSMTLGTGATAGNTYPEQLAAEFLATDSKRCIQYSFGVGGQTLTQMESDAATQIDVLLDDLNDVLVAWGGVNDFGLEAGTTKETIYARYVTYCTNRKAAGWKVYALTMLPNSHYPNREAERIWFNTQVKTDLATIVDGVVDVAGDSRIGDWGDQNDATYYDIDTIHLNNTGYAIISDLVYAAVHDNVLNLGL